MNIGIPGTGIGGLFYVVSALAAPLRKPPQKQGSAVLRCWILALGVLAGIFVTGWLLGFLLGPEANSQSMQPATVFSPSHTTNVVRWAALFASVLLLAAVLQAVQIARVILNWKRKKS